MQVINFSHPLGADVLMAMGGPPVSKVIDVRVQVDQTAPMGEQARDLIDQVGWTPEQWQRGPFLIVLPGLAPVAAAILAEIHGRSGHFPGVIRLKPVPGAVPPRFEFAELLALQSIRDAARMER